MGKASNFVSTDGIPMLYGKVYEKHDTRFSVHESIHCAPRLKGPKSVQKVFTLNFVILTRDKKLFVAFFGIFGGFLSHKNVPFLDF